MRMMMVSQKNADGGQQRQSVSLVMVSAKGRVAVYDLSLKLAAAFTLRLSSAPVASIKAPLSIPSAASGTSANSRPNAPAAPSTAITSYNAGSSQKVFFSFDFFLNSTSSKCLNYNAHSTAFSFFSFMFCLVHFEHAKRMSFYRPLRLAEKRITNNKRNDAKIFFNPST